jgi:uncharacterized membrane protein YGL010W
MRSAEQWLAEYGSGHRNPTNERLHWICVPVIVMTVLGLLWALPLPAAFAAISPWLNWGTLAALAALGYYARLSPALAFGIAPFLVLLLVVIRALEGLPWPLWQTCVALFVVGWIVQFIGHAIEGQRPSFFKDVQFLLIGPLWLVANLFRHFGIAYRTAR